MHTCIMKEMKENELIELEILSKFGDEKSNLVDRYERLSFEIQLNQAMLARCLSDSYNIVNNNPGLARTKSVVVRPSREELAPKEGSAFKNVLKKMLKPMALLGRRTRRHNKNRQDDDHDLDGISTTTDHDLKIKKHPWTRWNKSFSRSTRLKL